MKVESTRLLIVLVCLIIRITNTNGLSKRQQCRDFAGDRSNCQRFIRCFHNLRVVFTCASGTAYVPELQTCVAKELVTDCNDSVNRVGNLFHLIEVTMSSNDTLDDNDDYPTIEADLDALEAPMQKSLSSYVGISITSRRFGCSSYCYNDGICVLVGQSITCRCQPGYIGARCQVALSGINPGIINPGVINCNPAGSLCQTNTALALGNQCLPNPCQNGGSCYLTQTAFACVCPTQFSGTRCEINLAAVNPCYNQPCRNDATCQVVAPFTYRCICLIGFIGVNCDQRPCDPNPCLYGGRCLPYGNTFQCQCPPQYTGRCCELLFVTTAAPNPCSSQPCLNGGTCSPTSATAFICTCSPSYYGRCCELRNYCQPNPCYNGGTCIATTNAYLCQCIYPYTGSNCEITIAAQAPQLTCACIICPCPTATAVTHNPCVPNPCQNNGGCNAVQNTAQCFCQAAFTGYYCEYQRKRSLSNVACANITCLNHGKCYVNETEPQCACPKPYFGERCESINRPRTCNPNPCSHNGQCISTKDGYKCICKNDRTGILCEQMIMPKNHRWCPLDCRSGTTCVYEGSTPVCRVL
ncbi:unnamed protein product [Rotaria sp. Silwood1]|nr:unnamed protein product [Rotaria sp. Silwood1]CAF3600272.1 unnamed protein product [Rotaria sp. Silwood1]